MLMIESGRIVSRSALRAIPVPQKPRWTGRGAGNAWMPINHGVLADAVVHAAGARGLKVVEEQWATNGSETDLFGAIVFGRSRRVSMPRGLSPAMALRHSNAGRYAVTFGFGAEVGVCTNGVLYGEHVVSHKHTRGLSVEALVDEGIDDMLARADEVGRFVARLRGTPVGRLLADRVIVEAGRRDVMPWSQLGKVEREWRRPSRNAFRRRTAWSLYNAFTEVNKQRSPAGQLATLRRLEPVFRARTLERLAG